MALHEIGPWITEYGMMIDHKYTGTCLNQVAICIDIDAGALLKIGSPEFVRNWFTKAAQKYKAVGLDDAAECLRMYEFDQYKTIDMDGICTLVNYLQNCPGKEKVDALFTMDEEQLKQRLTTLQRVGF